MSTVESPPANQRVANELRSASEMLRDVQRIIGHEKVIAQLDLNEIQRMQSLDLATQIIDCVATLVQSSDLAIGRIKADDLRPADLAARLMGQIA